MPQHTPTNEKLSHVIQALSNSYLTQLKTQSGIYFI